MLEVPCSVLQSRFISRVPDTIRRSKTKRKAEFLAGRLSASYHLFKRFGINESVGIHEDRSPIWPLEILGSISHTNDKAICLLSAVKDSTLLGVDIENIMSIETVNDIKGLVVFSEEEKEFISSGFNLIELTSLLFSAKESLFKALYPKVKSFFDFSSANAIRVNSIDKIITLELTVDLCSEYIKGDLFICHYSMNSRHVITYIYEEKL